MYFVSSYTPFQCNWVDFLYTQKCSEPMYLLCTYSTIPEEADVSMYVRTYVCVCASVALHLRSHEPSHSQNISSTCLTAITPIAFSCECDCVYSTCYSAVQCRGGCFFSIYCVILDALYTCKGTEG